MRRRRPGAARAGGSASGAPAGGRRGRVAAAVAALSAALAAAPAAAAPEPAAISPPAAAGATAGGAPGRGERLFSGQARFANGGPPCGACHAAAGLPFPGGGTLGPDLSRASPKYGPQALDVVLTTLFFPTMNPVFAGRPLTPGERADLSAFLAASAARPPPPPLTLRTLALGVLALALFLGVMVALGWTRLRGVRAPLVRAASRRLRETRP